MRRPRSWCLLRPNVLSPKAYSKQSRWQMTDQRYFQKGRQLEFGVQGRSDDLLLSYSLIRLDYPNRQQTPSLYSGEVAGKNLFFL